MDGVGFVINVMSEYSDAAAIVEFQSVDAPQNRGFS
jgi:hypothetical protein